MKKRIINTGDIFGNFKIIRELDKNKKHRVFECQCECGNTRDVYLTHLTTGKSTKCKGCASRNSKTTHGMSKTRIFRTWRSMRDRCSRDKCNSFRSYGGRGIKVCKEWENSFDNFYTWATGSGYSDNLTIERIDVNGDYEPQNCTWIPMNEQAKNTRLSNKIGVGVYAYKFEKFTASITRLGIRYYLGIFETKKEAVTAREIKKKELQISRWIHMEL